RRQRRPRSPSTRSGVVASGTTREPASPWTEDSACHGHLKSEFRLRVGDRYALHGAEVVDDPVRVRAVADLDDLDLERRRARSGVLLRNQNQIDRRIAGMRKIRVLVVVTNDLRGREKGDGNVAALPLLER